MAVLSSAIEKTANKLALTPAALQIAETLWDVMWVKSLSAPGKQPLFKSWDAMMSTVTGHLVVVGFLPDSWLMVCHALRLDWVKSIDSMTFIHLALRVASSFSRSAVAVTSTSTLEMGMQADCYTLHPSLGCIFRCSLGDGFLCCLQHHPTVGCVSMSEVSGFRRLADGLSVSVVSACRLASQEFHLLTGFPTTSCTSDGIRMRIGWWYEQGNLLMNLLSDDGSSLRQTTKAISGVVTEFHVEE